MIVQDTYDIPADITEKIFGGQLQRIGGVIRVADGDGKGQIYKMLDPIDTQYNLPDNASSNRNIVSQSDSNDSRNGIIIASIVTAAIAMIIGGIVYYKHKKAKELEKKTYHLKSALAEYFVSLSEGDLSSNTIDELMNIINNIDDKDYSKMNICLSTDDVKNLVFSIHDYTEKLAKDNDITLTDDEKCITNNSIINLQSYLNAQKRILESA